MIIIFITNIYHPLCHYHPHYDISFSLIIISTTPSPSISPTSSLSLSFRHRPWHTFPFPASYIIHTLYSSSDIHEEKSLQINIVILAPLVTGIFSRFLFPVFFFLRFLFLRFIFIFLVVSFVLNYSSRRVSLCLFSLWMLLPFSFFNIVFVRWSGYAKVKLVVSLDVCLFYLWPLMSCRC